MSILSLRGSFTVADRGEMSSPIGLHRTILPLVKKHVELGSRILDLGAGAGAFSTLLELAGFDAVSADMFPDLCKRPCHKADMNGPFSDSFTETFDAICCFEVLEHIENPRLVLRQCKRLLNPNGMLFVSTPDASGIYSRVRFLMTGEFAMFSDSQYRTIGHITPISRWQVRKMLAETSFDLVDQADYDGTPSLPKTVGDAVKLASRALRPLLSGQPGSQTMIFVCRSA